MERSWPMDIGQLPRITNGFKITNGKNVQNDSAPFFDHYGKWSYSFNKPKLLLFIELKVSFVHYLISKF